MFFGRDDVRFEHTWEGAGGATRLYPGFTAMANEEDRKPRLWRNPFHVRPNRRTIGGAQCCQLCVSKFYETAL
ncbi:MAG: hypothetical protein WKF90_16735 [Pyrinomonadaceae bacterium]